MRAPAEALTSSTRLVTTWSLTAYPLGTLATEIAHAQLLEGGAPNGRQALQLARPALARSVYSNGSSQWKPLRDAAKRLAGSII